MDATHGFDFINYLKRRLMLGVVDPWRKTFDDKPIYTILVPLQTAYDECKLWSNQEFTLTEFINYLKINDIYLFKNIDGFKAVKEEKEKTKGKRKLSEDHRKKLSERMKLVRQNIGKKENGANQVEG